VILPAITQGAEKAGRSRSDVILSVSLFAAVNDGQREFCRQQISFYASTPSYRPVMELHGWGEIAAQLSGLASRGQWGDMPGLISDAMLDEFCVQSDEQGLASAIHGRYTSLADRVTLYMPFVSGSMDAFWKQLVDNFKTSGR
jgi:alkanesulfonate monooxygenase SsuD/methylene tetrahydromethanopterin reductase-like flavin-dependent oxidoreductase (luciferase family)